MEKNPEKNSNQKIHLLKEDPGTGTGQYDFLRCLGGDPHFWTDFDWNDPQNPPVLADFYPKNDDF